MSTMAEVQETVVPTTVDVPAVSDKEGYRREVLLKAAEIIEEHGWIDGAAGMDTHGPYCLLGAVARAMGAPVLENRIVGHGYSMDRPSRLLGDHSWMTYTNWNDCLAIDPRPKRGFLRKEIPASEIVTSTLRKLANGASWEEATQP